MTDNSESSNCCYTAIDGERCSDALRFQDVNEAKGYNALGIGRGPIVMSNIFLSSSLLTLSSIAAGCEVHDDDDTIQTLPCTIKIHGFLPSSLLSNIAIFSGLLSALTMPFIGALVDFTPYRREVGIISATVIILIQATQIGTVESTWFLMAILQAIAAFVYQVQLLATYAYLPEIARIVGQDTMTSFTSIYGINLSASALVFLLLISIAAMFIGLDDVKTAQLSQAVNVIWVGVAFMFGWRWLPKVPALQTLPQNKSLIVTGFKKIWDTTKGINEHYGGGVRWFFLAVMFAEAGFSAFSAISVTYLAEVMRMSGGELGIVFAIVYIMSLPGARIGAFVTTKTNPVTSWKLCIITFSLFTISGALILTEPSRKHLCYVWSALWGMGFGWNEPTKNLIFSLCLPQGQEAELTGYFVYFSQILVWLPPLIFTAMNEAGKPMQHGLMSLVTFFFVAFILLMLMDPWESVVGAAAAANKMNQEIMEEEEDDDGDYGEEKKIDEINLELI